MILYCINTTFQLLSCITHKIIENPDNDAVLLINPGLTIKFPNYDELQQFGFQKIIINKADKITAQDSYNENKIVKDIVDYYDKLFLDNKLSICDFAKIYVFSVLRFSCYLIEKKISFKLFEDAPKAVITIGRWVLWQKDIDKKLCEKYKLIDGNNKYIDTWFFYKTEGTVLNSDKTQEYDLISKLQQIQERDMTKILSFFGADSVNTDEIPDNLILFRRLFDKNADYDKNQNELLKIIIDWFAVEGNIIVKTHPFDSANYHLDSKVKFIKNKIPSELLPYIINPQIKNIVAAGTSAANLLANNAYQVTHFTFDIGKITHLISRLFVSLKLLNSLDLE